MSQHFLISPAARTLSLRDIMRMSDDAAHERFVAIRFALNDGGELAGEVEIDGAYFGSRIRPANRLADRRQQRRENSNRQVVVVARERGHGRTIPWVVGRESDAVPMIRQNVASGTEVHADES